MPACYLVPEKSGLLLELKVKDLGIIEDINWRLDNGLNVITGETGAGKSLVIDAVELLLTGSGNEDIIRHGAAAAFIEGVFVLTLDNRAISSLDFLLDSEPVADENHENRIVINCDIRRNKPGMVRINGRAVTKTVLRQLGQLLVDIHGQSQHLSLLDKKCHLDYLDAFSRSYENRNQFAAGVSELLGLESEIKELEGKEKDQNRQEEFLKYQIEEIKRADLRESEDEELEKEKHLISFSEKLKEYSVKVYEALHEGDASRHSSSALIRLNEASVALKKLADLDPSLNQQLDFLDKAICSVEEIARDVRAHYDNLPDDPGRLEEIESRLELIRNLKRKYGQTIPEILTYREKAEKELAGFGLSTERRSHLGGELAKLKERLGQQASVMSKKRSLGAGELMEKVRAELQDLEMAQVQFVVSVTQQPAEDGLSGPDGRAYGFRKEGIDNVEFLVATNPGEPLKPLSRISSTGEISRFTLALKGALAEADNIPVLIFDEIDIGVGGRNGDTIGKKLWALARRHQVICVTHLPQIAAYADAHYCVHKEVAGERAASILESLDGDSRIKELAMMLGGADYSETAWKNALELREKAEKWKTGNGRN